MTSSSVGRVRAGVLVLIVVAAVALAIAIWANERSQSAELDLPSFLAGVEQPAEIAFGDAVMSRDQHAWGRVFDELGPRFGQGRLRVDHLTLTADVTAADLRRDYDLEMVDDRGWQATTAPAVPEGAWAFGYETPDGSHVLMLVGLEPRAGETLVPLTLLTTLPEGS